MGGQRTVAESAASKAGLAPGAATWVGEAREGTAKIDLLLYGPDHFESIAQPSAVLASHTEGKVAWYDVVGVHDTERVTQICQAFAVHPLAIEDVLHVATRPKAEHYHDHLLVTLPMMTAATDEIGRLVVNFEHIAIVLGDTWVLTFQVDRADVWSPVRRRIREDLGRIRSMGPDYLMHGLLDAIVDGVFEVLERIEDEIDTTEARVLTGRHQPSSLEVHHMRGELSSIRRALMPIQQSMNELLREDTGLVCAEVRPYLRDVQDHVQQVLDICESSNERLASVHELGLALAGQRLNQAMQVLTVVSMVFLPLSFLVGLYGMNFDVMPELHLRYGYFVLLGVMAVIAAIMLGTFWKAGWLSPKVP